MTFSRSRRDGLRSLALLRRPLVAVALPDAQEATRSHNPKALSGAIGYWLAAAATERSQGLWRRRAECSQKLKTLRTLF